MSTVPNLRLLLHTLLRNIGARSPWELNRKLNWKGIYPVSCLELLSSGHPESLDVDVG